MIKVMRINQEGYFVEDVLLEDWEETSEGLVSLEVPAGLYLPRYVAGEWVEGKSQEEIDAIRNVVAPKTDIELLKEANTLLQLNVADQNQQFSNFMDYIFSALPAS